MLASTTAFTVEGRQRGLLYRQGRYPGARVALWLALADQLPQTHPWQGIAGLWIAELMSGALGCFASAKAPSGRSLGGRVVLDLAVLDSDAPWVEALAQALSRRAATLPEAEQGALQQALEAFVGELDPQVIAAVRADGEATPAAYNHYVQGSAPIQRNRQQAALSFPRFAGALRRDWPLRRTVEQGLPLTPALAHRYQVREASIRRLRTLPSACLPASSFITRLKQLDRWPANAVPKSSADWAVFITLADGLEALVERAGLAPANVLQPFQRGWEAGLLELEQRLQAPFDLDAIQELMHCAYHYGVRPAVSDALTESGRAPPLLKRPPPAFFPLWFGHYGLSRLAQMASRWQQRQGELSLRRMGVSGDRAGARTLTWPGLLRTGATHEGVRVVELTSCAALELEGQRLEHCVASYAIKCLLAESAIFSLRDGAGEPLATFEVRVQTRGAVTLLQQHARANQPPSPRLQAIAERFVTQVLHRLPPAHITAVRGQRRALGLKLRPLLSKPNTPADPLSATEQAAFAEAIAFAHPASVRRQGLLPYLRTEGAPLLVAMCDA